VLAAEPVDVLVSDLGMPCEDGFSLMQKIRKLPEAGGGHIPALALSAYARNEDITRALAVGFQRHLPKPTDFEELGRAILALLGRAEERVTSAPSV